MIEILQKIEAYRVHLRRGHSSLFSYVVTELKLGENIAYSLITVARKSREVPELKARLQAGTMTISNARRIVAVLTPQNQKEWIEKATELSNRKLEKEIARVRPKTAPPERAFYVSADRMKLEVGLSEPGMLQLRRTQDLLSQSRRRSITLEETIDILTADYLRQNDPLERAKRYQVRKETKKSDKRSNVDKAPVTSTLHTRPIAAPAIAAPSKLVTHKPPSRAPIAARVRHQINLRDQKRCTHVNPNGSRCRETRWVELHHLIPVANGGTNAPGNLITLCSGHHRFRHL